MNNTSIESRLLLSVPEVAELIGSSVAHVWRLIASGRFGPAILKLGRLSRVRRDEFSAWIEAGCPPRSRWTWKVAGQ